MGLLLFHLKDCGKEQEAEEKKAHMFVYVCLNMREISRTHMWYGSGRIFDGIKKICQSQRATCHYHNYMKMQNLWGMLWKGDKDFPICKKSCIQSDQLNFHSSKGSLGRILEETGSNCKEVLKKVNWSIYTHIWANTNFICRSGSNSQPSSSFDLCSWWHKSVEYPLSPSHLMYGRSSA